MTTSVPRSPELLLLDALDILADLLRRTQQCQRVCHEELSIPEDDPMFSVHESRAAIAILGGDLDRIGQDCLDQGLLDTAGNPAVAVTIGEPVAAA